MIHADHRTKTRRSNHDQRRRAGSIGKCSISRRRSGRVWAYDQNPKVVKRWLDEEYPAIRRRAKREDSEIYRGDEMGVGSGHRAGRSYAKRGRTPVIPGTGQRFGCNLISTIANRGTLRWRLRGRQYRPEKVKHTFTKGTSRMRCHECVR